MAFLTYLVGEPLTADDLGVGGALTVLLKDALMPTLMQVCVWTGQVVLVGSCWYTHHTDRFAIIFAI